MWDLHSVQSLVQMTAKLPYVVCLLYSRGSYSRASNNKIALGTQLVPPQHIAARSLRLVEVYTAAAAALADSGDLPIGGLLFRMDRLEQSQTQTQLHTLSSSSSSSPRVEHGFPSFNLTGRQLPAVVVFAENSMFRTCPYVLPVLCGSSSEELRRCISSSVRHIREGGEPTGGGNREFIEANAPPPVYADQLSPEEIRRRFHD